MIGPMEFGGSDLYLQFTLRILILFDARLCQTQIHIPGFLQKKKRHISQLSNEKKTCSLISRVYPVVL